MILTSLVSVLVSNTSTVYQYFELVFFLIYILVFILVEILVILLCICLVFF